MILTVTLNPAVDKTYKLDDFHIGDVFRASQVEMEAGGKGINVARVCSILGERVIATGFLGGSAGVFIRRSISHYNIVDSFIDIEGETRTSIAIADLKRQTTTEILEKGPNIPCIKQREFIDNFITLVDQASIVVLAGSLPMGIDSRFYGRLIDIAKERDKRVILDTSGLALKDGIEHIPYMVKPNLAELRAFTGRQLKDMSSIENEAYKIYRSGIELVCITLGEDGAIVVCKDGTYRLSTPAIEVVNTVGCGDAFVAGCVVGHVRQYSIENTLKYAMACGMANTQFSKPGRVDEGLVDKFQREVSIFKTK